MLCTVTVCTKFEVIFISGYEIMCSGEWMDGWVEKQRDTLYRMYLSRAFTNTFKAITFCHILNLHMCAGWGYSVENIKSAI